MAVETGLGWSVLDIDDAAGAAQDVRDDVTNLQFATPRGVQDVTPLSKSAMKRLLLLADFSVTLNFVFDDAVADSIHSVMKTVPSTSVARTTTLTVSGQTLAPECYYTDYSFTRAADGSFTGSAPGVLADGTVPTWS
jgi:hypothetical protein